MTAAPVEQLPRLLALVPYLLARPGVRVSEAAAVFGVSEERLRKDLNLLWVCGLPGHGPGDLIDVEFEGDTITLFEPAGVTRPLRLTVDEALALVVALRALAETPGLVARFAGEQVRETAVVRVRTGTGWALRADATASRPRPDGWDVLELGYTDPERLADRVAGFGAHVVVEQPSTARQAVVQRLRAAAGVGP